jgi:hypothetical protein
MEETRMGYIGGHAESAAGSIGFETRVLERNIGMRLCQFLTGTRAKLIQRVDVHRVGAPELDFDHA